MKTLNSYKGFTLLEILVAIAIIGITLTIILQLFSSNLRAVTASKDYVQATVKAEERMRALLEEELSEGHYTEQSEDGYTIDIDVKKVMEDKTENLQVELVEIGLSVKWQDGFKEKKINLNTYKVREKEI